MDYRKSDLYDDAFKRYLKSCELTLETEDVTGSTGYKFVLARQEKVLKENYITADIEYKEYVAFKKKERKHELKIIFLDFHEISEEKYNSLSFFKRWKYRRKRRKHFREMDKFWHIIQIYRPYIPYGEYAVEDEEEPKAVILEQPEEPATPQEVSSEENNITQNDTGAPAGDTPLLATKENDGETEKEEENADALLDFFGETEND